MPGAGPNGGNLPLAAAVTQAQAQLQLLQEQHLARMHAAIGGSSSSTPAITAGPATAAAAVPAKSSTAPAAATTSAATTAAAATTNASNKSSTASSNISAAAPSAGTVNKPVATFVNTRGAGVTAPAVNANAPASNGIADGSPGHAHTQSSALATAAGGTQRVSNPASTAMVSAAPPAAAPLGMAPVTTVHLSSGECMLPCGVMRVLMRSMRE